MVARRLWSRLFPPPLPALPSKCFISHSYRDSAVRERLLRLLPPDVEPVVFPPITVAPDEMVSTKLISAILDCEGMICLRGRHSDASFWVAFERDYARRAGKKVFSFDPRTGSVTDESREPLDLRVSFRIEPGRVQVVKKILDLMKEKRHIELHDFGGQLFAGLGEPAAIFKQTSVLYFHSADACDSASKERGLRSLLQQYPDRILVVLLDPLPPWIHNLLKVSPSIIEPVPLYADDAFSLLHRIDDLIVRVYWLTQRNDKALH